MNSRIFSLYVKSSKEIFLNAAAYKDICYCHVSTYFWPFSVSLFVLHIDFVVELHPDCN